MVLTGKRRLLTHLLIHDGADQLTDSRQRQVSRLQGDRLSGEADLKQEGDAVQRPPGVCGARRRLTAVRQPAADGGGRTRGRRRQRWGWVLGQGWEGPW